MSFKYMVAGFTTYGYDEPKPGKKSSQTLIPSHITNVDFYDKKFM